MTTEDKRLEDLLKREWDKSFENSPEFATFMGEHKYNDRLSDLSFEAIEKAYNEEKELLKELKSFNQNKLSETNKLNLQLFTLKTENSIISHEFEDYLMPISQMGGIQNLFGRMINIMPFNKEKDYQNYLSRLNAFPKYIDQTIAIMEKGVKRGFTIPKIAMMDVPNQISRQLTDDYKLSSFYEPLNKLNNESLKDDIEEAIKNKLYTSFNRLKDFINEKYIPNCRESFGLSELPRGKEFYNHRLKDFTTTELTAQGIHDIGKREVERIFGEITVLMKELGFDSHSDFLEHLRTNPDFYFKSENHLLMSYRDFAKRIDKELPAFFKVLPRLPYGVEKVPDHQAPSCPTAYYMGSDINMTRAGIFYANTYQLETRPKYEMEALTLHEAVPGHHLQISLALELDNLPEFRKSARFIAYIEGWALYTEKLGAEMGFYQDPYAKFGQYSFEIWRACRLVVDTGLHAFNWTREHAIDYLQHYTGKTREACTVEVDRYIVMPGQATTYKIGELKILELRKKFENVKQDNFDIREFHDLILRNGALPLNVLENYVSDYLSN